MDRFRLPLRACRALSLIELLVVLAIVGLLAALLLAGGPGGSRVCPRYAVLEPSASDRHRAAVLSRPARACFRPAI